MSRKFFQLLILILPFTCSWGQSNDSFIKGKIRDENGDGLPFAAIYLKNSSVGTTSNINGDYQLKVPKGPHTIIVQFVGYQRIEFPVEITGDETITKDIALKPQVLQLNAVTIEAEEDPAYRVIREAIRKRKFHENEVNAYSCDVYIKGLQRLDERPEKILGFSITVDTGIVYLSESVSKFNFERPNKIKEVMVSSKVSGNNNAFSWNQASDMLINFYQNNFTQPTLSERPIISPISNGAFGYYDYKLEGYYEEGDNFINKIKLIPKGATDPVFSGHIYIIENSWKIHSIDVLLTKQRGLNFVDSVGIKQINAPARDDIWLPISQDATFKFKVFGFKGSGHFVGVYSNYEVEPNYDLYQKEGITNQAQAVEKIDLFEKNYFTNEVLKIDKVANERDSAYWAAIRPVPLSRIEEEDYIKKDSIAKVKESKPYKDSIDAVSNKPKFGSLLTGYNYQNSFKGHYWNFPSALQIVNYNTVEGTVFNFYANYRKVKDQRTVYSIRPTIRHSIGSSSTSINVTGSYNFRDTKFTRINWGIGNYVFQFNKNRPITEILNTYYTLVEGENFLKIYGKEFIFVEFRQEIKNGLLFTGKLSHERRNPFINTSQFSFERTRNTNFTPNAPENVERVNTEFDRHDALILEIDFRFRIGQRYISRPDRKIILGSKYPQFRLSYKGAIPIGNESVNYNLLSIGIFDQISFGTVGTTNYSVKAGQFISSRRIEFPDFYHFNGNQTFQGVFNIDNFQTLDYYLYSTQDKFFEGHFEHHFNEFLLNALPLIKKLNLQTVFSTHALVTPAAGNYVEFGIGIEHIFKILRVDYYEGLLQGRRTNRGVRVGFGF